MTNSSSQKFVFYYTGDDGKIQVPSTKYQVL